MSFWRSNIDNRGRIIRGVIGLVLLAAAGAMHWKGIAGWPWLPALAGAFTLFEAARGWCVLRACRIKTRF